jgi:hypothetical protein
LRLTKEISRVIHLIISPPKFSPPCRFLSIILILLMLLFSSACSPFIIKSSESSIALQPAFTFSASNIMIDNGNDFVWKGVTLTMNDGYIYTISVMPRGVSSIPLAGFRDAGGNSFNPQSMVPRKLNIQVHEGFANKPGSFDW